jgi:hypothetical protein
MPTILATNPNMSSYLWDITLVEILLVALAILGLWWYFNKKNINPD